jgi:hypothetical protein
MSTIVFRKLSGSSDGSPINLTATTSTGAVAIHTCSGATGVGSFDEVYLWAINNSTGSIVLNLEIGDTDAVRKETVTISSKAQPTLVLPGIRLSKAVPIKGWKGTATLTTLAVMGNVNRISS